MEEKRLEISQKDYEQNEKICVIKIIETPEGSLVTNIDSEGFKALERFGLLDVVKTHLYNAQFSHDSKKNG